MSAETRDYLLRGWFVRGREDVELGAGGAREREAGLRQVSVGPSHVASNCN